MPAAFERLCAGGCGAIGVFRKGKCDACASRSERLRGTASARGYGVAWRAFRPVFVGILVAAGIVPACGASLPDGPHTTDSQCQAKGLVTMASDDGSDLALDHEPPLSDAERRDLRAVCDPHRIQLLCRSCHSAKTLREQ